MSEKNDYEKSMNARASSIPSRAVAAGGVGGGGSINMGFRDTPKGGVSWMPEAAEDAAGRWVARRGAPRRLLQLDLGAEENQV